MVPEDLFDELLAFLDPWDLVKLDDSKLECHFGEVVASVRILFRLRRGIILSTHWLELGDLASVVAAYLTIDPIISRETHRYIDTLIKTSRTSQREKRRIAIIRNLES